MLLLVYSTLVKKHRKIRNAKLFVFTVPSPSIDIIVVSIVFEFDVAILPT